MKLRTNKELRTILFRYLKSRAEVRLGYLFGTQASGKTNRLSDVDVAILVRDEALQRSYPYGYKARVTSELMRQLKTNRVDLVLLNQASYFLRHRVVGGGTPVFVRSEKERVRFEANVMSRYPDIKRLLAPHWKSHGIPNVDRDLLKKKLNQLRRAVQELREFQRISLEELEDSLRTAWSVEHGLQVAVQIVIDVGNHILASIGENQIEDYVDVIDKLGKRRIVPADFSRQIRDMAGFRNILVHEYGDIDLRIVHDALQNRLDDFTAFIQHIESYLKKH